MLTAVELESNDCTEIRTRPAFDSAGQALNPEHQGKRRRTTDKGEQPEELGAVLEKRGRGRPRKTLRKAAEVSQNTFIELKPAGESSKFGSAQSESPSYTKAGRPVDQLKAATAITIQDLAMFVPPVVQMDMRNARLRGNVPEAVTSLYNISKKAPQGFIPIALKVGYFVPRPFWSQGTNSGAVGWIPGELSNSEENPRCS